MSVGRICSRVVVTVRPDESVRDAAVRMCRKGVGTLVVVEDGARPVGIVTDRDVAVRCVGGHLDPDVTEVADVMTAPVRGVLEGTPIEEALSRMAAAATRRLVVVDAEDRLVGLLAMDDVLDLLAEEASDIGRLLGGQSRAPSPAG